MTITSGVYKPMTIQPWQIKLAWGVLAVFIAGMVSHAALMSGLSRDVSSMDKSITELKVTVVELQKYYNDATIERYQAQASERAACLERHGRIVATLNDVSQRVSRIEGRQ